MRFPFPAVSGLRGSLAAPALALAGALVLTSCSSESLSPSAADNSPLSVGAMPLSSVVSSYPNEPAGFLPSRMLSGTVVPRGALSTAGYGMGSWYGSQVSNASVVGGAIQVRFPSGWAAGKGPVNFGGYDVQGRRLSGLYLSEQIQFVGPTFENQQTGTKLAYLASGRTNGAENEIFFLLKNNVGQQGAYSSFPLQVLQQGVILPSGTVNRTLTQNVDRSSRMTAGSWHQLEAVFVDNVIGQANGSLEVWLDGSKLMDYHNMVYRTTASPLGFGAYKIDPIWGGALGTRTRTDFMQLKDIYISGVP